MAIRLQPMEIEICENDPFRNDLLGRKEPVEVLTSIVGSIEGPCVLAVDAAWGTGKTTFLRMWSQHLKNCGFPVVEFNAWETDFTDDPFIALSSEILNGLEKCLDETQEPRLHAFRKAIGETVKATSGPLFRLALSALPYMGAQAVKELDATTASSENDATSEYLTAKGAMQEFKTALHDTASELTGSKKGKPLVLMIDELDRCRPSYAVELLEAAKHLFMVDHIIFVLAVDRAQLAHSVKVLYGNTFDAEGYLRRFFDVDYRLPFPERNGFIRASLEATGISNYYVEALSNLSKTRAEDTPVYRLLMDFFNREELSLRQIAQAIYRLSLVFASLPSSKGSFAEAATVAVILRTIDLDLYQRFVRNEISDLDVVERIVDQAESKLWPEDRWGAVIFESLIILAAVENRTDAQSRFNPGEPYQSPLMAKYEGLTDQPQADNKGYSPLTVYASSVLKYVRDFRRVINRYTEVGFRESVRLLELLSTNMELEQDEIN